MHLLRDVQFILETSSNVETSALIMSEDNTVTKPERYRSLLTPYYVIRVRQSVITI
jgi:hypothetical protein